MICWAELNVMRVMIIDIALRSHRRTSIRIDRSIYTRREVRGKLRRVLDRNYGRWWNDGCRGVQCDCEFRVSLAKPQNAPAVTVCRVGLSALLSRSAARIFVIARRSTSGATPLRYTCAILRYRNCPRTAYYHLISHIDRMRWRAVTPALITRQLHAIAGRAIT